MTKEYILQWNYFSSYGGPWRKGERLNLEPALAAQINVDSPGVLVEAKAAAKVEEPAADENLERTLEEPPHNRQVKQPGAKR